MFSARRGLGAAVASSARGSLGTFAPYDPSAFAPGLRQAHSFRSDADSVASQQQQTVHRPPSFKDAGGGTGPAAHPASVPYGSRRNLFAHPLSFGEAADSARPGASWHADGQQQRQPPPPQLLQQRAASFHVPRRASQGFVPSQQLSQGGGYGAALSGDVPGVARRASQGDPALMRRAWGSYGGGVGGMRVAAAANWLGSASGGGGGAAGLQLPPSQAAVGGGGAGGAGWAAPPMALHGGATAVSARPDKDSDTRPAVRALGASAAAAAPGGLQLPQRRGAGALERGASLRWQGALLASARGGGDALQASGRRGLGGGADAML